MVIAETRMGTAFHDVDALAGGLGHRKSPRWGRSVSFPRVYDPQPVSISFIVERFELINIK